MFALGLSNMEVVREPSAALSETQRMALLRHIEQRPIIEDRSTSNTINYRKRKAWDEITASFNASYPDQIPRSAKQLKRIFAEVLEQPSARGMRKTSASVPSASLTQSYDPLVLPGPTPGPSSVSSAQFTEVPSTVYLPLFSPSVPVSQVIVPASPVIAPASPNIAPASPNIAPASAVNAPDSLSSDIASPPPAHASNQHLYSVSRASGSRPRSKPRRTRRVTSIYEMCDKRQEELHKSKLYRLNREHEEEMKLKKEMMLTQKLQQTAIEKTHEKLNNSLDLLDSVLRKAGAAYDAMAKTYEWCCNISEIGI
ncbi:putative Myb/SANT-like DNA-binding domain-containing protein 19 [Homarus americanus]|uniref:Regulatory protein zeste n=1 Tax=Homarus americanus TaxID=6706 RepID=A0A8J5JKV3_HOMAM|nr:putative Myb/SANT-like DNA-binding domain-containing protein 19 [Homarus americanus]